MKTKLLKKVRKRFSIEYYPFGVPNGSDKFEAKYLIKDKKNGKEYLHHTKRKSINLALDIVRKEYYQYSRKYKQQSGSFKVWYNG